MPRKIRPDPNQTHCQPLIPSAPVDVLVDDTLRIIFEQFCLVARGRVTFFEPREVLKICLVSRRWNRIARDHAMLWTHIHIQRNKLAQLQFKLSRKAPLQIIYGNASHMCQHSAQKGRMGRKIVDDIEKNMDRVELLSFEADLKKLERLVTVRDLIPILFSTRPPQFKSLYMLLKGMKPANWQFEELLARPFHDHELGLHNVHLNGNRPSNDVRFLNGLTRIVVDAGPSIQVSLLSVLRSNPALEELDIRGSLKLDSKKGTGLVMECLKGLRLGPIYSKHLEALFQTVSLPVIQEMELKIDPAPWGLDIKCLRDTFLKCPGLRRLFAFPEYLSFYAGMGDLTIHAVGSTKHEVRISVSRFDTDGLFDHILEMFPNLNTLRMGPEYTRAEFNLGTSSGITKLELFAPACHELRQTLKRHISLPSLSQVTLIYPYLKNDDHWRVVLDLFPEQALQKSCIVHGLPDLTLSPSDQIRQEILERNIHFEWFQSSESSVETGRIPIPTDTTGISPHSLSALMGTMTFPSRFSSVHNIYQHPITFGITTPTFSILPMDIGTIAPFLSGMTIPQLFSGQLNGFMVVPQSP